MHFQQYMDLVHGLQLGPPPTTHQLLLTAHYLILHVAFVQSLDLRQRPCLQTDSADFNYEYRQEEYLHPIISVFTCSLDLPRPVCRKGSLALAVKASIHLDR